MKKIHVMPIMGLSNEVLQDVCTSAFIGISGVSPRLSRVKLYDNWCAISFADVENPDMESAFSIDHALLIKKFITELPDDITDLYICCDSGESRSPAVAAALLTAMGKKDSIVWENPYYKPNCLVYKLMRRAFGIEIEQEEIYQKRKDNECALSRTIENADCRNFKRWSTYE